MLKGKIFSFLISFYLLFVNSITLTHHHEDGQQHTDCQICVLRLNQQSDDPNDLVSVLIIEAPSFEYNLILESFVFQKELSPTTLPRSPPVLV